MDDQLTPYQLSQIRDALGQAGLDQGGMFLGGLRSGTIDPHALAGELALDGSIRRSVALSAGLRRSTNLSVANATWTYIPFDTVEWDSDSISNLGTYPTRLTAITGGVYAIYGYLQWAVDPTGQRMSVILLNSTIYLVIDAANALAALAPTNVAVAIWSLKQGDYVELGAYQNSGTALNLTTSLPTYGPTFTMARIA